MVGARARSLLSGYDEKASEGSSSTTKRKQQGAYISLRQVPEKGRLFAVIKQDIWKKNVELIYLCGLLRVNQ